MTKKFIRMLWAWLKIGYVVVFVWILVSLYLGAASQELNVSAYRRDVREKARAITGFAYEISGGESGGVTLPYSFSGLAPRTPVTFSAEIQAKERESLLVKTVYAPVRIYADDVLIFEYGQDGSYPSFLHDPPTMIALVPLAATEDTVRLRVEFLSPTQRNNLLVAPFLVGDESSVIREVFAENAFVFLFSCALIFIGLLMVLLSFTFLRRLPVSESFLWLGLFAGAVGTWGLGECDLSIFFIPYPSVLYVMAFSGLFSVAIPFLRYGLVLLRPKVKPIINSVLIINCLAAALAFVLQWAGITSMSRSMYFFHVIIPVSFIVFSVFLFWEALRGRNKMVRQFLLPIIVLTATATLELLNYRYGSANDIVVFFEGGMIIFVAVMVVVGGRYTRSAFHDADEKIRLEMEMLAMSRQLGMQREQYELIAKNSEQIKAQRHDLRHQLTVLKGYAAAKDLDKLSTYLDELTGGVACADEEILLCHNYAVNSVARHYLSRAKAEGIQVDVRLDIPEDTGAVPDMDLCIIMGNLLENALEACCRMAEGPRFIHVRSKTEGDYLSITVDNSFDGIVRQQKGKYLSHKGEDGGVGLLSVQAVAEKYDGLAEFKTAGNTFLSSALVTMRQAGNG